MHTLVLFDIDGTLLSAKRAGHRALQRAGEALVGPGFDHSRAHYPGSLDPSIIRDLLLAHDLPDSEEHLSAFREGYARHMPEALEAVGGAEACPGIFRLLDAVDGVEHAVPALLTGNFPETGSMKLRSAGIDPARFRLAVWGDESVSVPPLRDDLPGVALRRLAADFSDIAGSCSAVVVGDTPADIRCARAHDLRVIATATGPCTREELEASEPDALFDSLEDTQRVLDALLDGVGV